MHVRSRTIVLAVLCTVASAATVAGLVAPRGSAGTKGALEVSCVMGDVGCEVASATVNGPIDCSPWYPIQPVTCSGGMSAGAVSKTTVYTGAVCLFVWPLIPPFPPADFVPTVWETRHGTAIVRPDGSVTVHCPPGSIVAF